VADSELGVASVSKDLSLNLLDSSYGAKVGLRICVERWKCSER